MPPSRTLIALGAVIAGLVFAAPASAHHVDINKSAARCVLVNNVPTLQVDVVYVDFEEFNKPVSWSISVNGTATDSGLESWPPTENPHVHHWSKAVASSSTSYAIFYSAHWGRGYTAGIPFDTVVCPQPVPPPPAPPAPPPPTPPAPPVPPPVDCHGKPMPPGTTPPTCKPKAPCVPYPNSRYKLINRPDMNRMDHGLTTFKVKGPRIKWVHFTVDRRYTFKDHSRPFVFKALLWRTDIWGPALWGDHVVTAKVRTRCKTVTLRMKVFNHDPPVRG